MRGLIINIAISFLAFFAGFKLYVAIYPESRSPSVERNPLPQADASSQQEKLSDTRILHFSSYKAIGEKNLFRPERREWTPPPKAEQPEEKKAEENKPKPPPPRLTLYGTIIYEDNVRIAIIQGGEESGAGQGSGNYRLGEEISGYRIEKIKEDMVVLARGEDVIELKLREGKSLPGFPSALKAGAPRAKQLPPVAGMQRAPGAAKPGEEPERIVVKGPGGKDIVKQKKVIRTPFGPKTIYIEER